MCDNSCDLYQRLIRERFQFFFCIMNILIANTLETYIFRNMDRNFKIYISGNSHYQKENMMIIFTYFVDFVENKLFKTCQNTRLKCNRETECQHAK